MRKSSVSSSNAIRSSSQRTAKGGTTSASLPWSPRICRRSCAATTFRCWNPAEIWTEVSWHGSAGPNRSMTNSSSTANGVTRFGLGQYAMKNALSCASPARYAAEDCPVSGREDRADRRADREEWRAATSRPAGRESAEALITRTVTKGLNPFDACSMKYLCRPDRLAWLTSGAVLGDTWINKVNANRIGLTERFAILPTRSPVSRAYWSW